MTYPIVRATVTKEEQSSENLSTSDLVLLYHKVQEVTDQAIVTIFDPILSIVPYAAEK